MSAGAAALPTIIAAATSILAVAFKPRELFRLCRRRPLAAGASAAVAVLLVTAITWWMASPSPARAANRNAPGVATTSLAIHYDWAKVAEDILARERIRKAAQAAQPSGAAPVASSATDKPAAPTTAPAAITSSTAVSPSVSDSAVASAGAVAIMLGQDASRCSYAGGPSPVGLERLWSFGPEDTMFLSAPLVAGKRVYVAGCQSDLGGYTGLLACLDADTGKPLWQVSQIHDEPMRPFFSSPALSADGKFLLIGQGLHQDHDCALLCFDATTGELRWTVKTTLHIESSPAIRGDTVVVGAGAIEGPDGKPTGDAGHVIAARISDGKELWRQPVADPESSPIMDADGNAYIGSGFNGSAIVALRTEPEDELRARKLDRIAWRTPVGLPVTCPITLAGDYVVAGAGNSDVVHSNANAQGLVVALDRRTGKVRWQTPFADAVLGAVACRGKTLVCPVRTGEVAALALDDGHVLWRSHISGNVPVIAGCAFTDDRVYAVSADGYLAVLDAKDGKVLEKTYLNDQAKPGSGLSMCPPRVAAGRVYVGSETGGLQCLAGTGSTR
jgi:outer membrane protein assembly factor BamB